MLLVISHPRCVRPCLIGRIMFIRILSIIAVLCVVLVMKFEFECLFILFAIDTYPHGKWLELASLKVVTVMILSLKIQSMMGKAELPLLHDALKRFAQSKPLVRMRVLAMFAIVCEYAMNPVVVMCALWRFFNVLSVSATVTFMVVWAFAAMLAGQIARLSVELGIAKKKHNTSKKLRESLRNMICLTKSLTYRDILVILSLAVLSFEVGLFMFEPLDNIVHKLFSR